MNCYDVIPALLCFHGKFNTFFVRRKIFSPDFEDEFTSGEIAFKTKVNIAYFERRRIGGRCKF